MQSDQIAVKIDHIRSVVRKEFQRTESRQNYDCWVATEAQRLWWSRSGRLSVMPYMSKSVAERIRDVRMNHAEPRRVIPWKQRQQMAWLTLRLPVFEIPATSVQRQINDEMY